MIEVTINKPRIVKLPTPPKINRESPLELRLTILQNIRNMRRVEDKIAAVKKIEDEIGLTQAIEHTRWSYSAEKLIKVRDFYNAKNMIEVGAESLLGLSFD